MGLSADGDVEVFNRRRAVEIKHGRISMFATIGYIVPEYFRFPGYLSPKSGLQFEDVPNGLAAISKLPPVAWQQIVVFIGSLELFVNKQVGDEPGNFGKGNLGMGLGQLDEETRKRKLSAELANGRLAMMAIIGMFFQDGLTGSAWGDWASYTQSPLRAFEEELGVQPPVGFWDPLGLSADGDVEVFNRRRAVEIKHGRISMFATIGYIVPEYFRFPGDLSPKLGLSFEDVPNGLAAISKLPPVAWQQIVVFIGFLELFVNKQVGDEPGNFGKGNLGMGLGQLDEETRKRKLSAELANGRLAMMAIIGMFFQDGLTGSAWGDWASYTESPLRAFEEELGVQPPVGFWDPLGLSADGDVEVFNRRRAVEIKHGRISMFATIGYIVPEYFRFPGDLSPKLGLSFEDVPNGLAAISKLPPVAWQQIVVFIGFLELFVNKQVGDEPGNFGKGNLGMGLGQLDEETRKRKLSAELANGRLAMMAIIGMFFQDGLTGSAWGDWASYTESPLRAFEEELGVQPPVGFWDPLGLSADGDVEVFNRRRAVEIKHGRISMFATIGYIVPEYFRFPGYLSPKSGLQFEDVPNGLAAISKLPPVAWQQIVVFIGSLELFVNKQVGDEPGNFGKGNLGMGLGQLDEETRKRKLSAELANGRLAMMAIIGMFFQDGLTGSAWGDWASYTESPLRAFESERGVQPPLGFWDPLGLSADGRVLNCLAA